MVTHVKDWSQLDIWVFVRFLWLKRRIPIQIHSEIVETCHENAMSKPRAYQWYSIWFKDGYSYLEDEQRSDKDSWGEVMSFNMTKRHNFQQSLQKIKPWALWMENSPSSSPQSRFGPLWSAFIPQKRHQTWQDVWYWWRCHWEGPRTGFPSLTNNFSGWVSIPCSRVSKKLSILMGIVLKSS